MKVMGHRGAKDEFPENTLKSIKFALDVGCSAVEIDVHLSSDNKIVVIHDDTVDRTTNGKGKVLQLSSDELRGLDAGQGEKIPYLAEVLDLIKSRNCELVIEVKAANLEEKLIALLKEKEMIEKVSVISFNHRIVKRIKELCPQIKTACLLYGLPVDAVAIARAALADGLSICVATVDKELVDQCHKEGIYVAAWNVNDKESFAYFKQMGIDFLGTDKPSIIAPLA